MPLRTLTRPQFQAKRPGGDYAKYQAYLARNRPARVAARQDPLAPRSDQQIRSRVRADVMAETDPQIADINRAITRRSRAETDAIGGYTNQLAQALGGYEGRAKSIYGDAQARQAAVDAALSGKLTASGDTLAEGLSARLAQAGLGGERAASEATQDVRATGSGAGNALYGVGSAGLSDLISRGAGAQAYAAAQPGIARLAGMQQLGQARARYEGERADQVGKIRSRIPGLIAELMRDERATEFDKVLARLTGEKDTAAATAKAQQPDSALSKVYGYVVDANGNPIMGANGKVVPVAKTGGAAPGKARMSAVKEARTKVFELAKSGLGQPMKNPNADSFRNPGIYLTPDGKGTNDENAAARDGGSTWDKVYKLAYAAVSANLLAQGVTEKQVQTLIETQLRALGYVSGIASNPTVADRGGIPAGKR